MPRIRVMLLEFLRDLIDFSLDFFFGRPAITQYFLPKVEQLASVAFRRDMWRRVRTPFARIENVRTRRRMPRPVLPVLGGLLVLCLALPVTAYSAVPDDVFFKLCAKGTAQEVGEALSSGADIGARGTRGTTALMYAAKNPDPKVVTLLLAAGAKPNVRNQRGETALMMVVEGNSPETVKFLLDAGVDVNAKDMDGVTALMRATAENANQEVLRMLLAAGVKVNARDRRNWTALIWAANGKGSPEMVRMLLRAGAHVNARSRDGETALTQAVQRPSAEVAQILLAAGANVNAGEEQGVTPLMVAVENRSPAMVQMLLDAGAHVNARNRDGATALICAAVKNSGPETVRLLLKAGADANARTEKQETALMWAAGNSNLEVVKVLLDAKADAFAVDSKGHDALWYAQNRGKANDQVVNVLKKRTSSATHVLMLIAAFVVVVFLVALTLFGTRKAATVRHSLRYVKGVVNHVQSLPAKWWGAMMKYGAGEEISSLPYDEPEPVRKPAPGPMTTEAFLALCQKGTAEEVRQALEGGAYANARDPQKWSALMWAVKSNSLDVVEALLNAGAEVNARDGEGGTALIRAAEMRSQPEIIKALLNAGADIGAATRNGWTALGKALARDPSSETVRVLLEAGAGRDGELMNAVRNNLAPVVVTMLVQNGANVNHRDAGGMTPLMRAVLNSAPAMVEALLEAGADVNARNNNGWTSLMLAVADSSRPETVKALLNAGADADARNDVGETALSLAMGNAPEPEVIAALVRAGADGTSALMNTVRNNLPLPIVTVLIQGGVDVNYKDGRGMTPLMWAVANNAPEVVKALLDGGADANAKNDMGETALNLALENGSEPAVITTLVRAGADGTSALMHAVRENPVLPVLAALIQGGANVNGKDDEGMTPLMWAVTNNAPEVAKVLLEAGANVDEREDGSGRTALMLAVDREDSDPEVVETLLEAGANVDAKDRYERTAEKYARNRNKVNWQIVQMLEEGHARYPREMIRQIVRDELVLRPAPENKGSGDYVGRITNEFNGPLLSFGEKFWEYIKEKSPKARELLTDKSVKIISVEYIDRFLCSPLTCSLLCMILAGLKDSVGAEKFNDVHIEISTQANHASRSTAQYIWENWQSNEVRNCVLAGILESFGIHIIVNETSNHDRWLYVGFSSGEKISISLGSGVSYWRMNKISEGYHFDFSAQPFEQRERLKNIIKNPQNYIVGKSQEGTNFNIKIQ